MPGDVSMRATHVMCLLWVALAGCSAHAPEPSKAPDAHDACAERYVRVSGGRCEHEASVALSKFRSWGSPNLLMRAHDIGDEGARAIAENRDARGILRIDLSDNGIGEVGARALAESAHLVNLKALSLADNAIGDEGAKALAGAQYMGSLQFLDLSGNGIGDEGARALAESPYLPCLVMLSMNQNVISEATSMALQKRIDQTSVDSCP